MVVSLHWELGFFPHSSCQISIPSLQIRHQNIRKFKSFYFLHGQAIILLLFSLVTLHTWQLKIPIHVSECIHYSHCPTYHFPCAVFLLFMGRLLHPLQNAPLSPPFSSRLHLDFLSIFNKHFIQQDVGLEYNNMSFLLYLCSYNIVRNKNKFYCFHKSSSCSVSSQNQH